RRNRAVGRVVRDGRARTAVDSGPTDPVAVHRLSWSRRGVAARGKWPAKIASQRRGIQATLLVDSTAWNLPARERRLLCPKSSLSTPETPPGTCIVGGVSPSPAV